MVEKIGDVSNNNASEVETNEGENHNSSEHVVDIDDVLVKFVETRVEKARESIEWRKGGPPAIYRVPSNILSGDMNAYVPTMVSIGPYHRGREHLQAMEALKWQFLHYHISNNKGTTITEYLQMMKGLEEQTRRCYSEEIKLGSDEFTKMMLLDGCFLLHIILGSLVNDPRFTMWFNNPIIHDLLKLENQLPYFIVQRLYNKLEPDRRCQFRHGRWKNLGEGDVSLQEAALYYFSSKTSLPISWGQDDTPSLVQALQTDHLLGLFHCRVSKTLEEIKSVTSNSRPGPISWWQDDTPIWAFKIADKFLSVTCYGQQPYKLFHAIDTCPPTIQDHRSSQCENPDYLSKFFNGATGLEVLGVTFERRRAKTFLDISFQNGVLGIPTICIDDSTNPIFRNLIAFELFCQIPVITIYSVFMDFIINTSKDVALLQQKRIIANGLGDGKEVATLFNQMCKNISYEHKRRYLGNIFKGVNRYCGSRFDLWRASLIHNYFRDTRNLTLFMLTIYAMAFTITQTVFSILKYYQQT